MTEIESKGSHAIFLAADGLGRYIPALSSRIAYTRAILEAIRQPTDAMLEAAILAHPNENLNSEISLHTWQAMIDEALK